LGRNLEVTVGWVVERQVQPPCCPVPTGPQEPAGAGASRKKGRPDRWPADHSSSRSGSPSVRPAEPGAQQQQVWKSVRPTQQQQVWKSVPPVRRAGRPEGRPSIAATDLEIRPSESSGWPGRGPARSRAGRVQQHRVVEPADPQAGRAQQQVWKSVLPSRRAAGREQYQPIRKSVLTDP
jgi:hypothetical protein